MKIRVPKVDIKSPNIDLKGPDYNLKGDIPDINVNGPKIDTSGNINLKVPNLKPAYKNLEGPNINSPDFNLSGNIPKMKLNGPKIDMPSAKVKFTGPNVKTPTFNLSGNINGINSKNKDFILSGIIPSFRNKNSNLEVKNYTVTPSLKFSSIDPNINLNSNIKTSLNTSRGASPGKRNFHGNLNDPNYLDIGDIKGSRRVIAPYDYDIKIPRRKKKLEVSGNKIIDEQDVILQPPFNINNNLLLQGQNRPKPDRKSIHLTVSQMQIQPDPNVNEIKVPDVNIDIKGPKLENDIDVDIKNDFDIKNDVDIKNDFDIKNDVDAKNNLKIKGGKFGINTDNKLNNLGEIEYNIGNEDNKDFKINLPKIEIKNEAEINQEIPNINIEKPKIEGTLKIRKKEPTNLRFKPIKEIDDNKYNLNIYIDNENNNNSIKNSISEEENSSKIISTSRIKKSKGLPTVGVKSNNFKSSRIDIAGRLDVDNVDVNNMKAANVGVNGVKLGERIIQ